MCCKGFVKRIVPFFLTFAVGLFIASFFVTIAAPSFQFKSRNWKRNHRQYDRQMELENQRLRDENLRLRNEVQRKIDRFSANYELNSDGTNEFVPPPIPNTLGSDGITEPRRTR